MELKGYTLIPDWMLSLDLDIYETIILAVIYGFSQDGESVYAGSQNYLALKAKCTRRKVANALPVLVDKGYVIKIDKEVRGVKLCEYRVCPLFIGYEQHSQGGYERHSHNNIDIDILDKERDKSRAFVKPSINEVREFCYERGNAIDPEEFVAFYESKGWMVGKNKMKDWKAAVVTWEKAKKKTPGAIKKESVFEHNLREMDKMYGTELHTQYYK